MNATTTPRVKIRSGENRRWSLCREALDREPKGWEFIIWIQERWREWDPKHGSRNHSETEHAEFDTWLEERS